MASGSTAILGNNPFNDSFAIDGDKSTMWIDATEGEFPDILIIAMPESRKLSSITILSNAAGWPTDYTVENLSSNSSWVHVVELKNIPSFMSTATFPKSVESLQFRITINNAFASPGQLLHTRINEVYPVFTNETMLTSRPPILTLNQRAGVIIGGVSSVCMVFTIILFIAIRARRRKARGQPQIWDHLYSRKKPPTLEKITLEVSTDTLRTELDNSSQTMMKETSSFKASGNELAGSNIVVAELAAIETNRTTPESLIAQMLERKPSNGIKTTDPATLSVISMKELPELPKTEVISTSQSLQSQEQQLFG